MASRTSPLATAFIWAVGIAAGYGLVDGLIVHEDSDQVGRNMYTAASAAGAAAYFERRRSPS